MPTPLLPIPAPICNGIHELSYAETERSYLNNLLPTSTQASLLYHAQDVLQMHILQGLAVTAGSALGELAPDRQECWRLFRTPTIKRDSQTVQMHVGGKAFTKHSHRASDGWSVTRSSPPVLTAQGSDIAVRILGHRWGQSLGPPAQKNALAESAFNRIWDSCTWRNLFWLPHRILAYEVRVEEGYGLRFQKDTKASQGGEWCFRGLVEPVDAGGHDAKWRH